MIATAKQLGTHLNASLNSVQEHEIRSGDYLWHVKTCGHLNQVCFLLHGTGASSHSWLPLMSALAEHYTVIAIDLPGHAQTQCLKRADLSLPGMAAAIKQLLADYPFEQSKNMHVMVGHSAGAAIAAQLLLDKPNSFERLVSINGALIPLGGMPGRIFPHIARISASFGIFGEMFSHRLRDPAEVDKLLANTGSTIDANSRQQYHELCKNKAHVKGTLQMMANWQLTGLYQKLSALSLPVQIIAGSNDKMIRVSDAYRLQSVFQHCELNVLPNLGHLAHEEQPSMVADIILKGES